MGLHKRGPVALPGYWWPAVIVAAACVAIALAGDAGRELLRYDRPAIGNGELYRLLSAHFTHLGPAHLVLNLAGLVLVWLLVGRRYRAGEWMLVTAITVTVASAGFWFLDRNLHWYVGFSGALHGLLIAGAVRGLRVLPVESAIIVAVVVAKLAWEQFIGPLPGSESIAGGPVLVNAHLYGAAGGALAAAVLWRGAPQRPPI